MTAQMSGGEVQALDWGDASFTGFEWWDDGRELLLHLRHGSLPIVGLRCFWASDLRVDLCWRRRGVGGAPPMPRSGPLLTWAGAIEREPEGEWRIHLEFPGEGELSLRCSEIAAVEASDG